MSQYAMVKEFHAKMGIDYVGPPRDLDVDDAIFRAQFKIEEALEYQTAATIDGNRAKTLDAIVDLLYVVFGTAVLHGFSEDIVDEAFRRVHAANMAKVPVEGPDDPRSSRGGHRLDVVKPEGWEPPRLDDLVYPRSLLTYDDQLKKEGREG